MAAPPAVAVHIAAACIADVDPLMRADEHDTGVVAKWSAVEDALDKHKMHLKWSAGERRRYRFHIDPSRE